MLAGRRTAFILPLKKVLKFTKQFNIMSLIFQLIGTGKKRIIIGKTKESIQFYMQLLSKVSLRVTVPSCKLL